MTNGARPITAAEDFGNRPINTAAYRGDVAEIAALLDAGADVNAVGEHGHTPLQEAVGQGHEQAVRLLLARGALTTHVNNRGHTALDIAIMSKRAVLIDLLQKAHRQQRRITIRRFASAAEADRHDVEYWRRLPEGDRVTYAWRLSQELWRLSGQATDERRLCRSVASVRHR